ncbi:MAG: cell wall metabolism sensor histidine kinase WalK, partial [Anaerolineales bacterium]|nr:cell wall metabolism sensor histidine kinase WalK [Anaerolineales bacterium]
NLLDNAIKYSRPGETITVEIELVEDERPATQVRIRDQGVGIPADHLPRIGQRFYRADRARSRSDGGSGLGVAIARALVQAHNGRLWIESEHGAGTIVYFTIPY